MDRKDQFIEWLKEKILSNPQEPPANAWEQISDSLDLEETWQGIGEDLDLENIWQKVDSRLHRFEFIQLYERIAYAVSGLAAIALLLGIGWGAGPGILERPGNLTEAVERAAPEKAATHSQPEEEEKNSAVATEKKEESAVPGRVIPKETTGPTNRQHEARQEEKTEKRGEFASKRKENPALKAEADIHNGDIFNGNGFENKGDKTKVGFDDNRIAGDEGVLESTEKQPFLHFHPLAPLWPQIVAEDGPQQDSVGEAFAAIPTGSQFPAMVAGIGSAVKLSWLMNNKTREALEKSSLTTAKPGVYTDLFLTYGVRLNKDYLLQAEGYLLDWSGQRYQEYRQGSYGEVEDKLLYRSASLSLHKAGRQLSYGAFPVFSQLNAGFYAGTLQEAREKAVAGVESKMSEYMKWHFGLQAGYAHDVYLLDQVLLTYGVRGRMDLMNIYSGTSVIPANFRKTRNASLDFTLTLKYVLKK